MILDEFKSHCLSYKPDILVQKYLIESETYFFNEIRKGEEFEFKKDIALKLDVHVRDIAIVGSGKLGFSLKPEKEVAGLFLFKEFDHDYKISNENEKSDLDIAIISSNLFDKEIKNLYNHTHYYSEPFLWKERNSLAQYALKGRLATRFLPSSFPLTSEIKSAQEKYQMNYGRVINIEIYKSWHFFETYHEENIKNIQVNLIS
jgi:hypothetical protein